MSIDALPAAQQWLWSDGDLATASSAGCQDALAEVYRRFYARLVRLCQVRVGDRELAEDIAQTTMLRAIRYLPTFETDRPMWPWLRVIALRQCATVERKRHQEVSLETQAELFDPAGDPCEALLEHLSLHRAMEGLPTRQRLALQLRYLDDMEIDEAATIIGVNRNAFDQLLARGRSKLAAAFSAEVAVRGVSVAAVIAFLRRGSRRAADGASTAANAGAPLMGASLAAAAGVAAILSLQLGTQQVTPAPRTYSSEVTTQLHPLAAATVKVAQHAAVLRRPAVVRPAPRSAPSMVRTYVAPHALSGGKITSNRFSIPTPVGTIDGGGEIQQSPGGATACRVLTVSQAGPQC